MSDGLLHGAALLVTAWLFGGMTLFAAGFAAFLFKVLPMDQARTLIRKAFPPFYLFVAGTAAVGALLAWPADRAGSGVLAMIALTTLPTRQVLMPAINAATDRGERARFARLHGLSVAITLVHIVAAATVLVWLAA